jgi:ribosomal protein S18 acetylase RimI-like enzyme
MLDRAELIAQSHHRQPNPILVHAAIVLPAPTTSEVDVVSRHHVRVITYRTDLDGITADQLVGFFEGWPSPPSPAALLEMLSHSAHVVLAVDDGAVIGFINALSDGHLAAYIPLLEVRATHRGAGVGSALVRRMLDLLADLYMTDLVCDERLASFYERLGLTRLVGMARRNRAAPVLGSGG